MTRVVAADDTFWQRYQRQRLVAFSCHEAALTVLRDWASQVAPTLRTHLYEYFLERPGTTANTNSDPHFFVPFVDWEAASRGSSIALPQGDPSAFFKTLRERVDAAVATPTTPLVLPLSFASSADPWTLIQRLCRVGPLRNGRLSHGIYSAWRRGKWRSGDPAAWDAAVVLAKRHDCLKETQEKLGDAKLEDDARLAWINIFSLLYTPLLARPDSAERLFFAAVPIASSVVFYGVLVAVIELPEGQTPPDPKNIQDELAGLAERVYLPTLILGQNSWEEYRVASLLRADNASRGSWFQRLLDKWPITERIYSDPTVITKVSEAYAAIMGDYYPKQAAEVRRAARWNCELEYNLASLWRRRLSGRTPLRSVKRSLVFSKMMIASPGMIGCVRDVLKASPAIAPRKEVDDPFPCVLVVGSPGSGKEKVSDLLSLFSPDFWDSPSCKVNMAAVRTLGDALKGPLQVSRNTSKAVVFFDELNSLDVAVQGDLLRVLEKGELPRRKKDKATGLPITWLIIGLINEDPGQLTLSEIRERTRDRFIFGEFIGALLYEHFKTRSRMRDDLYYRMRRCGEIHVPDLDQRREDLPILLHFLLLRAGSKDVFIAYDALRELVDPGLLWKGNVRQLELVARELASIVARRPGENVHTVSSSDMKEALLRARVPRLESGRPGSPS